jgi:hypothetical protein
MKPGWFAALGLLSALGCGSAAQQPHTEDAARRLAPVPACVMRLPARRVKTGVTRGMSEPGYWKLVFPSFDTEKVALPENAIPCTGRNVLADPAFTGGEWVRKYPLAVEEGEITLGSGGDRIKVLWLRTHRFADGTEAGPLAMVRAKEDSAEVYAVGVYRGLTKRPYFQLERIGPEVVTTVSDEGCTGNMKVEPCRNQVSVYLPRKGELVRLTSFASERRDYVQGGEGPGAPGRIEYHLTSSPRYVPEGIKLFEQVTARDEAGRELRRAEVERVFTLRDVLLVPNEGSLWPQIFPRANKEKEQEDVPPKAADGGGGPTGSLRPKYGCCDDDLRITPAPKSTPCSACARAPREP